MTGRACSAEFATGETTGATSAMTGKTTGATGATTGATVVVAGRDCSGNREQDDQVCYACQQRSAPALSVSELVIRGRWAGWP